MTLEELQSEFESEMIKKFPGLFLDRLSNGEYKHPDVYHTWMLYKTIGILIWEIDEES